MDANVVSSDRTVGVRLKDSSVSLRSKDLTVSPRWKVVANFSTFLPKYETVGGRLTFALSRVWTRIRYGANLDRCPVINEMALSSLAADALTDDPFSFLPVYTVTLKLIVLYLARVNCIRILFE